MIKLYSSVQTTLKSLSISFSEGLLN